MPAARRYDRVVPLLDIGDFAEFVDGCSCGDPWIMILIAA